TAWRFPDESGDPLGVRAEMPAPQIACCGLKVAAKSEDWMALVPDDALNAVYLRQELRRLHSTFTQAPLLGSLLDPTRSLRNDLATSNFDTLRELLERALATARPAAVWSQASELQDDTWDLAFTAKGLLDAARLLVERYHLVVTNVPYLARGKRNDMLKDYCEAQYSEAKNDLANVFLERCLEQSHDGNRGAVQIVMPQNWLFLKPYTKPRVKLLSEATWRIVAKLGPGAFDTISGEVVQAILLTMQSHPPLPKNSFFGIDAAKADGAQAKAALLRGGAGKNFNQSKQLNQPDARIVLGDLAGGALLEEFADCDYGICTGDSAKYTVFLWEVGAVGGDWVLFQNAASKTQFVGGLENLLRWGGGFELKRYIKERLGDAGVGSWIRGEFAWGKQGLVVSRMGGLATTTYTGSMFDQNVASIIPKRKEHIPARWAFIESGAFHAQVRLMDQKVSVTPRTMKQVSFDIEHWQQVAEERHPSGLPKPYSDDPTQWLFHGHPQPSTDPLQVAVARLAAYRWPAETDT